MQLGSHNTSIRDLRTSLQRQLQHAVASPTGKAAAAVLVAALSPRKRDQQKPVQQEAGPQVTALSPRKRNQQKPVQQEAGPQLQHAVASPTPTWKAAAAALVAALSPRK